MSNVAKQDWHWFEVQGFDYRGAKPVWLHVWAKSERAACQFARKHCADAWHCFHISAKLTTPCRAAMPH